MTLSQVLLTTIVLFVISRTLSAYARRDLTLPFTFIWLLFWLSIVFMIFNQRLVSSVAKLVGISRGVDLVIYVSLIVIFYTIYKFLLYVSGLEKTITKLVRQIALREAKSNPGSK